MSDETAVWLGAILEETKAPDCLEILARRCGARAYSIALALVRNRADAEDLVQEALVKTFERRDQLRDASALDAWFYRIVTRLCLDSMRKQKRTRGLLARLWSSVAHSVTPSADSARLVEAVSELPDKQRLAIVLRFGHDFTVAEVASALDVGTETAKTHLGRGMKNLRSQLGVNI